MTRNNTRLDLFLRAKVIYVSTHDAIPTYIGRAADGVLVDIGNVGDEDQINAWLRDYPTPAHW